MSDFAAQTPDLSFGLSPSVLVGVSPLVVDSFEPFAEFEPFADIGDSPPQAMPRHEELHHEVAGDAPSVDDSVDTWIDLAPPALPAVPDLSVDVESDDAMLTELLNLEPMGDTEWGKSPAASAAVAAPLEPEVKAEEHLVPQATSARPPRGAGSRRKVREEIRDELDITIYSLFPADVLRLPRAEFQSWREQSGIRQLNVAEQKRLSKIRRMVLARVYAERTRVRKIKESHTNGETLSVLRAENGRLKRKAAKLEAAQSKLRAQLKHLLALKMSSGSL